jgi:hypothetical protein
MNMGNNKERMRAQSDMGSSLQVQLEEVRAALRDKENELNMLHARLTHASELVAEKQRTIDVQQATQNRFQSIKDERVQTLHQRLAETKRQAGEGPNSGPARSATRQERSPRSCQACRVG